MTNYVKYIIGIGAVTLPLLYFLKRKKSTLLTSGSDSLYRNIADRQFYYMDRYGTDDRLPDDLVNLTGTELIKVYNAFGLRGYSGFGGEILPDWAIDSTLDLFGWYNEELDDEEKNEMRMIWQKTGLPITF